MSSISHVLLLVLLGVVSGLKQSHLNDIDKVIRTFVGGGKLPTAVRLAFHDCVGGCDGCLNVDDPDNAGLGDIVDFLETAYLANNWGNLLSRADLWAYTAHFAINKLMTLTNADCAEDGTNCFAAPKLVFKTGRVDCPTAPYYFEDEPLPAASMGHQATLDFFADEFGFTAKETVALLGAHTVGRAIPQNSGYKGPWDSNGFADFDNGYYKLIVNSTVGWAQNDPARRTGGDPRWQWTVPQVGMMLDVDMALYKDVQVDSTGLSSCGYNECALSSTADVVTSYANDNNRWIQDFAEVFTKMQAHGDFTLSDLEI